MWNTHSLVNYSCLVSLYKLKNISETLETETREGKSAAWLSVFHVILHLLVGKKGHLWISHLILIPHIFFSLFSTSVPSKLLAKF